MGGSSFKDALSLPVLVTFGTENISFRDTLLRASTLRPGELITVFSLVKLARE